MLIFVFCLLLQEQDPQIGTLAHYESTVITQIGFCKIMQGLILKKLNLELKLANEGENPKIAQNGNNEIDSHFAESEERGSQSYKALVGNFKDQPLKLLKKAHVKYLAGLATIRTSDADTALIKKEMLELIKEIEVEVL